MKILALVLIAVPIFAHAETTVKVTSFNYVGYRSRSAELCGKVADATSFPVVIKVKVDPKEKNSGTYFVTTYEETFCTVYF